MARTISILIFVLLSIFEISAQEIARVELKEFDSQFFPFKRPVLVYTPEGYDECTQSDYDVIYVFDAQARSHFDEVHSLLHFGVQQPNNDRQYIVVGVASPTHPEIDYERNNDFLPVPRNWKMETPYYGNLNQFKQFLNKELIPYINTNYRTSGHTLAIGHSLGASFVIDALTTDDMFDDIIAISPNLAWDEDYYSAKIMNFDFTHSRPRFIYMTMANEGLDNDIFGFPSQWRESWNEIRRFLSDKLLPKNIILKIDEMPAYSHNEVVLPAHLLTLKQYAEFRHEPVFNDDKLYPVHIELSGASVDGDVYVTGNQPALCDWNPDGIRMTVVNDTTRTLDINLRLPAEFKFTKGSWDYCYYIINGDSGNIRISSPEKAKKYYKTN